MTPVGRGHWCNGQNGEEEENALHPGVGEHSETKNRFQEKREDAGLEDTGWVRLLEGKKGTDRQTGGVPLQALGDIREVSTKTSLTSLGCATAVFDMLERYDACNVGDESWDKKKRLKCNKVF